MARIGWLILAALLAARGALAAAPEAWADKNLKVVDGLVAWYDGSVENAARRAAKQRRLNDGAKIDLWHDASGNGRHLAQTSADAQPIFRIDEELRFIRCDGLSQFLAADGLGLSRAGRSLQRPGTRWRPRQSLAFRRRPPLRPRWVSDRSGTFFAGRKRANCDFLAAESGSVAMLFHS